MAGPMRTRSLALLIATAAAVAAPLATAGRAHGEPADSSGAVAESLFQEGRKMMDAKRYGDACPKFLASYKLAPAAGTLLNLADCYEKNGQLASAWARFHEAIALAQRSGRPDREKVAKERADKLEPRLLRLTVVTKEPNVEVTLDGAILDPSAVGTALPVDPGKHTVEATARGKVPFTTTVDVGERTKVATVDVPPLDDAPAPPPPPPTDDDTKAKEPQAGAADDGSTQRTLGIVVAAAGGAGIVVGTIFGLRTSTTWNEAQTHCTNQDCDAEGVDLAASAKASGNISTVAFIVSGALLAGGAVLFLTAPKPAKGAASGIHDVRAAVGPGSLVVGGRF